MKLSLPLELQRALKDAERSPGWNTRSRDVRRFELAGRYGEPCTVYVVPFRRWAYRRVECRARQVSSPTPARSESLLHR